MLCGLFTESVFLQSRHVSVLFCWYYIEIGDFPSEAFVLKMLYSCLGLRLSLVI